MAAIQNRYEFVYLFDVTNGNPNGDPDAGNLPRLDPETNQGLVTDVCLKRKIRNFVELSNGEPAAQDGENHFNIFIQERAILEHRQKKAWIETKTEPDKKDDYSKLPKDEQKAREITKWMCHNYFDIRAFGAVMSTRGANAGQVRGPVQVAFGRSVEPILPLEISITRMAATTEKDAEGKGDIRTMGRKHVVPYGLYRAHGFINAKLAEKTGFSQDDLDLLWAALENMFEHDRSAARGEMAARKLIVFKHKDALGNAHAHKLFYAVEVKRVFQSEEYDLPLPDGSNLPPARRFEDYRVILHHDRIPAGVEMQERL
jgi:CRISPR-associated protein Csd2